MQLVIFWGVADEFLHNIDVNALKSELGLDVPDIAELAGISENGVYKWSWSKTKNGTRPSFNAIVRMLEKGATVETLFGVDYTENHSLVKNAPIEFLEGLKEAKDPESALNEIVERKIMEMKYKGKI